MVNTDDVIILTKDQAKYANPSYFTHFKLNEGGDNVLIVGSITPCWADHASYYIVRIAHRAAVDRYAYQAAHAWLSYEARKGRYYKRRYYVTSITEFKLIRQLWSGDIVELRNYMDRASANEALRNLLKSPTI